MDTIIFYTKKGKFKLNMADNPDDFNKGYRTALKSVVHREDGPAVIYSDGTEKWYVDGKLHRENGPAITQPDGFKGWYINDKEHRIDGPAIIWQDGDIEWYIDGQLHRVDGPAIEQPNGDGLWYLYGNMLSEGVEAWIEENNIDLSTEEGQTAFILKWS